MEDVLNQSDYPKTTKSSKNWDNEEIVDYDELFKKNHMVLLPLAP